jgi:hypothetical protein
MKNRSIFYGRNFILDNGTTETTGIKFNFPATVFPVSEAPWLAVATGYRFPCLKLLNTNLETRGVQIIQVLGARKASWNKLHTEILQMLVANVTSLLEFVLTC